MAFARNSSSTPSRSQTPIVHAQPDHFYGLHSGPLPPSPNSDARPWLDPADDPLANRGIPVFKPTMEEFQDFEGYMTRVEAWGNRSGIVKIIPPKEWTESLSDLKPQLQDLQIKAPIEQHMLGNGGLFRQENLEKRKWMSVREWVELCTKDEFRAPGVDEVGLGSRSSRPVPTRTRPPKRSKPVVAKDDTPADNATVKEEAGDEMYIEPTAGTSHVATPPHSEGTPPPPTPQRQKKMSAKARGKVKEEPKPRTRRPTQTRAVREANLAERLARDREFLETFDPHRDWLPPSTEPEDYTPEFCSKLERQYWRNLGLGKPAWYGADTQGSLFTDETTAWNVAHLPSTLSRLLPSSDQGLPGVNTPYLYFGMWRATFSWHVEDMDLFSINYIHFGAPKFWYAMPQGRAQALEQVMRGYFPKYTSQCPQFLRHKSFLASPTLLANSACRPNFLVQQPGEFVVTFPHGYHAGFNLGLNCAESVNFALDSWIDLGRKAKACKCISDSVRIDVDALLQQRAEEDESFVVPVSKQPPPRRSRREANHDEVESETEEAVIPPLRLSLGKRKLEPVAESPTPKKIKIKAYVSPPSFASSSSSSFPPPPKTNSSSKPPQPKISLTLKLGPRPQESENFPCCLCVSTSHGNLLKVQDPPLTRRDAVEAAGNPKIWMAHELCASILPETWVDEITTSSGVREKAVFGVGAIVKDRWNLKCSACSKSRSRAHGAPVQCTKGKCPKAFHVNCARDGCALDIVFSILRQVNKEVVLVDAGLNTSHSGMAMDVDGVAASHSSLATEAVASPSSHGAEVIKVVKKLDVQIFCTQHNPAVSARKKASKQDRIRNELLVLPPMARIKVRVSSGVFEVSLLRVVEENGSVEVLWDTNVRREFKWGSVILGPIDTPVQQKPLDGLPPPEGTPAPAPAMTPSTSQTSTQSSAQPSAPSPTLPSNQSTTLPMTMQLTPPQTAQMTSTTYPYGAAAGAFDYWAYAQQQARLAGQFGYPYGYTGYYPYPPGHNFYGVTPTYPPGTAGQYRNGQLQWQQPYQGPPPSQEPGVISPAAPQTGSESSSASSAPSASNSATAGTTIEPSTSAENSAPIPSPASTPSPPSSSSATTLDLPDGVAMAPTLDPTTKPAAVNDGSAMAGPALLTAEQLNEVLRNNPQLRDLVCAALSQGTLRTAPTGA